MTTPARLERELPSILGDLAAGPTPDYIDDVLGQTAGNRQRPAWTFPERWFPMAEISSRTAFAPRLPWRTIAVALIVIALLIAGTVAFIGSRQTRLPAPFGPAANGLIPYALAGDLYLGDPVTGATRSLLAGPESDWAPGFSADGSLIAFLREVRSANGLDLTDLFVIRPDGSGLRRINAEPIQDLIFAQWTPDGRVGVIHRVDGASPAGCSTSACQINEFVLLGTGETPTLDRITRAPGMDFVQFRPPTGGEYLYRATQDGRWGLFAASLDSSGVRTVVPPTVPGEMDLSFSGATWSPDGSRIFYEHGDADGCCRLWVVNADGTDDHEFLPRGAAWDGRAVPSPDGKYIAYWHNANDLSEHGVSVVRSDGTGVVVDTGPTLPETARWVWAPDSSKILMAPERSSVTYLLDPAGGPWTTVSWQSNGNGDLDWQRVAMP